jgi:hypothetical protein
VNNEIENSLLGKEQASPVPKTFKMKQLKSSNTVKTLLSTNVMALDTGIDWARINWENHQAVSEALSAVIDFIENKNITSP